MTTDNPFSAPVAETPIEAQQNATAANSDSFGKIAKRVFLEWEKLRFIYILVLGIECLILGSSLLFSVEFWGLVIVGGAVSNVCFFLGPIVETYLTWLGFRSSWLRNLLFIMGLIFTAIAAFVSILLLHDFPGPL